MEASTLLKKKISKKQLVLATSILLILLSVLFAYFYWKKTSLLKVVNDIPVVEYTKPPKFNYDIFGNQKIPFKLPLGILSVDGELFVSDSDMGVVQAFDYNGKFLRAFGNKDKSEKLINPYGMAWYDNTLYVADGGIGKIIMFNKNGEYNGAISPKQDGFMRSPAAVIVKEDKIYFTDIALHTINVMDLEGNILLSFGGRGEELGQVLYPHGIAIDSNNQIYVSDSGNNRVQIYNEDGVFQKTLGDEETKIGTPRGLSFDNKGNLYVVSGIENRVHVFDKNGKWIFEFNETTNKDSLALPNGITIDDFGQIFITETGGSKISLFTYKTINL